MGKLPFSQTSRVEDLEEAYVLKPPTLMGQDKSRFDHKTNQKKC